MDKGEIKLSIIIHTYNSKALVRQNILGIKKLALPYKYEIIVVDAGSVDKTAEMVKEEFPDVVLIAKDYNTGHSKGINIGLKEAKGNFILILNADIVFLKDSITVMLNFLEKHPEVGIVGPRLINPDKSIQFICRRYTNFFTPFYSRTFLSKTKRGKKYLQKYLMKDFDHKQNKPVEWIQGSCMMISKKSIEKIGYLDERFFLYLADDDWCRRSWEHNLKVYYLAEAEAIHYYHRESATHRWWLGIFSYISRAHIIDWIKYLLKYIAKPKPKIH